MGYRKKLGGMNRLDGPGGPSKQTFWITFGESEPPRGLVNPFHFVKSMKPKPGAQVPQFFLSKLILRNNISSALKCIWGGPKLTPSIEDYYIYIYAKCNNPLTFASPYPLY